jgi:O-antigen/teichoic acid export membrane protein
MPRIRLAQLVRLSDPDGVHWSLANQATVSGANFLTGLLVARQLGIEGFGLFSLAWLVVLFAQSIQSASIVSPMLSIGPKQSSAGQPDFYGLMFLEQVMFAAIASGAGYLLIISAQFAGVSFGSSSEMAAATAAAVFCTQIQEFGRRYNYASRRGRSACLSDLARYGCQIAFLLAATIGNYRMSVGDVLYVCAVSGCIGMLPILGGLPSLPRKLSRAHVHAARQLQYAKWLTGSALMQWTTGNLLIIATGALVGPAAVGALRAAQNLLGLTHVFFHAADNYVPPRAARIFHEQGERGLKSYIQKLTVPVMGATIVVCLIFAVAPNFWLEFAFGEEYSNYGHVVRVFALFYLLMVCIMPLKYWFMAIERTKPLFMGYLFASIATIMGSYPIIQTFGLNGALGGLVIVQLIILATFLSSYIRRPVTNQTVKVAT